MYSMCGNGLDTVIITPILVYSFSGYVVQSCKLYPFKNNKLLMYSALTRGCRMYCVPLLTAVLGDASRLTNSPTCPRSQTNHQREPTNRNYMGRSPTNRNYS